MTNFEKYFDDLTASNFGLVDGKVVYCAELSCDKCNFYYCMNGRCTTARMEWLKTEYEEPKKINIPDNTPINTKLLVSMDGSIWKRRYYAGCKDGIHLAWVDGATSWSSDSDDRKTSWEYMKLYE